MGLLDGKVAIITGGAQGIGLAIGRVMSAEGASIVLADMNGDAVTEAAGSVTGPATGVVANVTDPDDVAAMFDHAIEAFGRVDVLVNNAGITRDASLKNMTLDDFQAVIDVHLKGTWLCLKEGVARMKAQGDGGAIVNLSSISGKVGNFGQSNYAAAKAGIVGMTKSVAREAARADIRVNAIMPGLIETAMTKAMPDDVYAAAEKAIPLGRAGQPEEIGKVALFLASDLASYCTGITIEVAGGRHM